jgi:hypothetical protein
MDSMARIIHFISLTWIAGISEQQYIITVVTVIKFQAEPKLDLRVPQGCVLGPIHFLLYVIDLPKITYKTSAPIIFANDTSILFASSNLIDCNKNIHIVFETLNEWFKSNQLSLNFSKTNYIHFATKRNISINLKIG